MGCMITGSPRRAGHRRTSVRSVHRDPAEEFMSFKITTFTLSAAAVAAVITVPVGLDAQLAARARCADAVRSHGYEPRRRHFAVRMAGSAIVRSRSTTGTATDSCRGRKSRSGAQRNTNWEEADHLPNRFERYLNWTRAGFNNLDHNRDRRITANEWHYDVETFRRVDRNRDGALDQTEFLGGEIGTTTAATASTISTSTTTDASSGTSGTGRRSRLRTISIATATAC